MKANAWVFIVFAIAIGIVALFLLLFQKYEYYDYQAAELSEPPIVVRANFFGGFNTSSPHIRSGPYSLGVVIAAEEADVARGMVLSDVIVRSSSSKREVRLPIAIKTELKDGGGATEIVHSFRNLDLPYEDYEFRATVTSASGGVRPLVISLKIRKKDSFEWRVPLWDMLMSA